MNAIPSTSASQNAQNPSPYTGRITLASHHKPTMTNVSITSDLDVEAVIQALKNQSIKLFDPSILPGVPLVKDGVVLAIVLEDGDRWKDLAGWSVMVRKRVAPSSRLEVYESMIKPESAKEKGLPEDMVRRRIKTNLLLGEGRTVILFTYSRKNSQMQSAAEALSTWRTRGGSNAPSMSYAPTPAIPSYAGANNTMTEEEIGASRKMSIAFLTTGNP